MAKNERRTESGFLTVQEAARQGILPLTALRRFRDNGLLPGFYSGRIFLINTKLLKSWLSDPTSPINRGEKVTS